ncbi:hypothetical protein W03_15490 [Nitrosomonas sp. PY1]|uniref:hypothetical protein n=1 Tax=Nitrosomonas sp. PY1 TaxID=1803906 RepID=UPI001FC81A01|nr:hypothetical protein [Nitrosomonas sp. PY1]GKS69545.1 hypothetical protein W03_15490 [Nitrosomonas sp. PY1]
MSIFFKKTYHIALISLILFGFTSQAWATHISQPVIESLQSQYTAGDTVVVQGWVMYREKPTADVLLNFKLLHPDGHIIVDKSYPSDSQGQFKFKFDTQHEAPGAYQLTVTSHCLGIHRYACTYKNATTLIKLTKP